MDKRVLEFSFINYLNTKRQTKFGKKVQNDKVQRDIIYFCAMQDEHLRYLGSLFKEGDYLVTKADKESYGRDYTEDLFYEPGLVLFPSTPQEVAKVLSYCNEQGIPVYVRGAGTGLSGGALPVHDGVVMCMKKMNRILEINTHDFYAVVEPGVINFDLRTRAEELGLYYPPDPASYGSCFLGGNVAHGSGGPKAVKYGTTKDYVLNLEVVLPDGQIIWTGANTVKNSTGFNLTQLMVGSEGLLGVVTKIVLKLIAAPKHNLLMLLPFASAVNAATCVNKVLLSGIVPSALELMETSGVEISASATSTPFPFYSEATFYLLVELDGNNYEILQNEAETLMSVFEDCGALDVLLADNSQVKDNWWKVRRGIGEHVKASSVYKEEDTVVPRSTLPELLDYIKSVEKEYGFQSVCYGHAGDGNLHVNILKRDMSNEQWNNEIPKAIRKIFIKCKALGGTLSGEHGVGLVQKDYLDIVFSQTHMQLFREIKKAFDPKGILNPGKWI